MVSLYRPGGRPLDPILKGTAGEVIRSPEFASHSISNDWRPIVATHPAPAGLNDRGTAYWNHVVTEYELSASELTILIEVCRTLDDLDRLADVIASDGATTLGSQGQTVVHPALTEARGQRLALHRLVAALALPDVDGTTVPTTGTLRGKRAASARWSSSKRGA